jgi:hypothetical protein
MYCNCTVKHPLKNDANKNVFTVCAKSKGGCGKEIAEKYLQIEALYFGAINKSICDDFIRNYGSGGNGGSGASGNVILTGGGGSGGIAYIPITIKVEDKELCPDCNGDGYVTSLIQKFNYVHSCENCNGYGRIKVHGN